MITQSYCSFGMWLIKSISMTIAVYNSHFKHHKSDKHE